MDRATETIWELLAPLTNWERRREDPPRFDLEAMRMLLARPGASTRVAKRQIQVGGSKGKGTTAAYIEALARSVGLSTGVYASPHVSSICERARIDGRPVDGELFVTRVRSVVDWLQRSGTSASAFEVLTAAALDCFAEHGVDLVVMEVGLGGRLDATTAVDADVAVLTSVELEHSEVLGDTIEAIAAEKAAILRPGGIGVMALAEPARQVARARAAEIGCRLIELGTAPGRDLRIEVLAENDARRRLRLSGPGGAGGACGTEGAVYETELAAAPAHELPALALAWAALEACGVEARPARLARPRLPARFELLSEPDGLPLVVDGAHTKDSAEALARALEQRFPDRRFDVLFAAALGKRWQEVLSPLLRIADSFVITELSGTASEDPATIRSWLESRGERARAVPDAAAGLEALRSGSGARLVVGSFYLAGEVRQRLDLDSRWTG